MNFFFPRKHHLRGWKILRILTYLFSEKFPIYFVFYVQINPFDVVDGAFFFSSLSLRILSVLPQ